MSAKMSARAEFLARRAALGPEARAAAAERVLAHLLGGLSGYTTVAAYVPIGAEPGGPGLPDALRAAGRTVLLPVLLPDNDLDWVAYDGTLAPVGRGLREPAGPRLGVCAVASVDLLVVPALAVDRRGVRLGRGGGSYDRALARALPGTPVVALLYDGELVDEVPTEPHDRLVNGVITPSGGWCDLPDIG